MQTWKQTFKKDDGTVMSGALVSVFLSGTTTEAHVFKKDSSTANGFESIPITDAPQLDTDINGTVEFGIDEDDYSTAQLFDIKVECQFLCQDTPDIILNSKQLLQDTEGGLEYKKTYYQASEPTDSTLKDGDFWYDTDNDNKPYTYDEDSGTWVAKTWGTEAIDSAGGFTTGATTISVGSFTLDSSVPSLALGSATDYMTGTGIWQGQDVADSTYKMHIGDPDNDHLYWDGTELHVTGVITASSGTTISGTAANTFTVNDDLTDITSKFVFGRTTGGNAEISWDGSLVGIDEPLSVTGNITTTGTVDGVDVAALKTDVDGFPDELKDLVTGEIQQVENINSVTISNTQWGYLGALDQGLTTTSDVNFNDVLADGNVGIGIGESDPAETLDVNGTLGRGYISGILGSGWRIDPTDVGGSFFEVDNMRIRDTLRTHIFKKDIVRATNGYLYISDASEIADTVTTPETVNSSFDLTVKEQVFSSGDTIEYKDYDLTARSKLLSDNDSEQIYDSDDNEMYASGAIYSVTATIDDNGTREMLDGQGVYEYECTLVSGTSVDLNAGDTVVRTSGAHILADASSTYSPFIDFFDGTNHKARIGNLNGIGDTINGTTVSGYGLYSDNAFLKGGIAATFGSIGGADITSTKLSFGNIEIDSSNKYIRVTDDDWKLNDDGSGQLAGGNISWDTAGNTTISASLTLTNTISSTDISDVGANADQTSANTANDTSNVNGLASTTLISAGKIGTNLVNANSIVANSITATEISVSNLSSLNADLGTITAGTITLDSSGFLRSSGKDDYADTTAGFFLGYDTDAYKLNIGDANKYMKWDGTDISVSGDYTSGSPVYITLGTATTSIFSLQYYSLDIDTVAYFNGKNKGAAYSGVVAKSDEAFACFGLTEDSSSQATFGAGHENGGADTTTGAEYLTHNICFSGTGWQPGDFYNGNYRVSDFYIDGPKGFSTFKSSFIADYSVGVLGEGRYMGGVFAGTWGNIQLVPVITLVTPSTPGHNAYIGTLMMNGDELWLCKGDGSSTLPDSWGSNWSKII